MTGVYKGARYGHKLRLEQCPLLFKNSSGDEVDCRSRRQLSLHE